MVKQINGIKSIKNADKFSWVPNLLQKRLKRMNKECIY